MQTQTRMDVIELACASMWPLTMWVYATSEKAPPLFASALIGVTQYLVCITLAAFTLPTASRPLLSGAHAGIRFLRGDISALRFLRVAAAQLIGMSVGIWLLERNGVLLDAYWDSMRALRPNFWAMFAVQLVLGTGAGVMPVMAERMSEVHESFSKKGALWDMSRSGIWLGALCYPWGGLTATWAAWRWIAILYEQGPWIVAPLAAASYGLQCLVGLLIIAVWTPPPIVPMPASPITKTQGDYDEYDCIK